MQDPRNKARLSLITNKQSNLGKKVRSFDLNECLKDVYTGKNRHPLPCVETTDDPDKRTTYM